MQFYLRDTLCLSRAVTQNLEAPAEARPSSRLDHPSEDNSGLRLGIGAATCDDAIDVSGTLLVSLGQPLRLTFGQAAVHIPKHSAYYVPPSVNLTSVVTCLGPWFALTASKTTWDTLMREISRAGHDGLPPIAGLWENAPAMGHWCHQIAQSADARSGTLQPMQLFLLGSVFESVSRAFEATIARCPGRFTSQKALAFRRLKLTEQAIAITPVNAIGLDELAAIGVTTLCVSIAMCLANHHARKLSGAPCILPSMSYAVLVSIRRLQNSMSHYRDVAVTARHGGIKRSGRRNVKC
jgi:hypothetical protein